MNEIMPRSMNHSHVFIFPSAWSQGHDIPVKGAIGTKLILVKAGVVPETGWKAVSDDLDSDG